MKEELDKWLEDNKPLFGDSWGNILTDFNTMDLNGFVNKYDKLFKEKGKGWYDVKARVNTKPLAERLNKAFDGDFNPPQRYKEYIYKKEFSDVDPAYLDQYMKQMDAYKKEEELQRENEAKKVKREKEVKGWGLRGNNPGDWYRGLLASEYEKKRYIEDPNKSLFGQQAPMLGDAPETRLGAMGDLAVGGVGAVADVVPTPLYTQTWLGPTLRGIRDVVHYVSDDDKELSDVAKNFGSDMAFNVATDLLPNWRKAGRMFKGLQGESGVIGKAMNLEDKVMTMQKQVSDLTPLLENGDAVSIYSYIKNMPDSELKRDMLKHLPQNIHQLNRKQLLDDVNYWDILTRNTDAESREGLRTWLNNPNVGDLSTPHGKSVVSEPFIQETASVPTLTKGQNALKEGLRVGEKVLNKYSTPIIKSGKNIHGETPKRNKDLENEKIKEKYKNNESLTKQWLMGFIPREQKGDLMWEAYKEWKEENK